MSLVSLHLFFPPGKGAFCLLFLGSSLLLVLQMLVSCRILINFLFSLFRFSLGAFPASYGFNYIHLLGTLKPQSLAKILYIHYPMDISSLLRYCQTITSPRFFCSHSCFPTVPYHSTIHWVTLSKILKLFLISSMPTTSSQEGN